MGVRFLTFVGQEFLRLGLVFLRMVVSNPYVWGLDFLCLVLGILTFWGLRILTFGGSISYDGGYFSYVWWLIFLIFGGL